MIIVEWIQLKPIEPVIEISLYPPLLVTYSIVTIR